MTDNERFDVVAEVRLIKQRFSDWTTQHDKHTQEWRASIERMLSQLLEKFDEVPCKKKCQNEDKIKWIIGFVVSLVILWLTEYFKR